jgi:S-layer protein
VDDTQSETGPTANGFYSGAFNTASGWTSGAADGAKVVFTAPASGTTTKMVAGGDVAADVTAAIVAGSAAVAKDESLNDITYGDVNVDDHAGTADATITTVTLDGFDDALLGRTNSLDALTTLSLANGRSAELNTTQSALDLTVNNISSDLDLDGNGGAINITDLNITTVGADSTIIFTATAVTDLTIDAAVDLDASGSAFDALENVTIAGAGAVILDGTTDDTLATIDAANNEGGVTATVKGNVVVTGGDGNDTIEVSNDTITKAINLGAGDDTLTLAPLTTAGKISATVDGGDGDDTLAMGSADAEANSTDTDFDNAVTGFEMLYINDAAGTTEATDVVTTTTINLANLAYSNVITSGTNIGVGADTSLGTADDVRDKLVLDNLASDGMVVLTGDGDIEVNVADAADGTADNLDLVVANTQGSVTANNVETINIDAVAGDSTFALTADSVETISITGFEFVNLTDADSYWAASATPAVGTSTITSGTLTMIDASGMTDAGSVPVGGIAAATSLAEQTIKGSIGADYLTAADSKAVIEGGDGADTIFVTDGATSAVIDGGAGADTFDITGAALGVEAFATFNNVDAGDKFLLNASSFSSDEVAMTLDDPSTSDYINAAFNQTTADEAIWFQHNNNTYIVDNQGSAGFDAADVVVKLTGLVDLSAASFNDAGTLEVA